MRFAVLIYQDEAIWAGLAPQERDEYFARHAAFDDAAAAAGCAVVASEALRSVASATTVRPRDGDVVLTDGPFAETTEQLGGFYLLDAPDLDTVVALVRHLPPYTVEIRPVADL